MNIRDALLFGGESMLRRIPNTFVMSHKHGLGDVPVNSRAQDNRSLRKQMYDVPEPRSTKLLCLVLVERDGERMGEDGEDRSCENRIL